MPPQHVSLLPTGSVLTSCRRSHDPGGDPPVDYEVAFSSCGVLHGVLLEPWLPLSRLTPIRVMRISLPLVQRRLA